MRFWIYAISWLIISGLFAVAHARFQNTINPRDDDEPSNP